MAVYNDLSDRILSPETEWNGKTGQQVEDFLSRKIVNSMDYANSILTLRGIDGEEIAHTTVTVETPTYEQDILLVAVRVNGTIYKTGSVTLQYNSKTKVELAIATSSTAYTPSAGTQDVTGAVKVKISYGSKNTTLSVAPYPISSFTLDDSGRLSRLNKEDSELKWFDVTDLFSSTTESTIVATIPDNQRYSALNVTLNTQVISLSYGGNAIATSAQFTLTGGLTSDYHLEGYLGTTKIITDSGVMQYAALASGLNALTVKAVNNSDSNIATDYVTAYVINPTDFTGTAVAVNGVSNSINNHDTVKLYTITIYSPSKESTTVTTYLNDSSSANRENVLDVISLDAQDYDENNKSESEYYKYIEINSSNVNKHLQVDVDGELYKFYTAGTDKAFTSTSKAISVSKVVAEYLYTQSIIPSINFDQIVGRSTTLFNDSPNYWTSSNGKIIYSVEAQSEQVFTNAVNLNLENNFTLEFGLKSSNISSKDSTVISFGQMLIKPTSICWNTDSKALYDARFAEFSEGDDTHILITVTNGFTLSKSSPYYPDYFYGANKQALLDNNLDNAKFNLVRIYINGCIAREIKITDAELLALRQQAYLQINPTTSDLDLYLLRVYNSTALDFDQVQHNYISFLSTRTLKDTYYDANDVLGTNGAISFTKALNKYNTLVYIFPKGGVLPNRSWHVKNNTASDQDTTAKKLKCTLFVNYKDADVNKYYGGRITNGLVKGQGSSAMRYLIWNTTFQLNKMKDSEGSKIKSVFTPYQDLDSDTNKFIASPAHQIKGYYNMPNYDGQVDTTENALKVTKLVGKVNFASSMQSHKEGACKLYNDAYKYNQNTGLLNGGRKAVQEEAFLYFYLITDADSVENYELADLINNDNVKFMGFQTWGSAKGDNATFGYDSDKTPEYILIEGGENSDKHVQFQRPWSALQRVGQDSAGNNVLTNFPTVTAAEQTASDRDYSKNLMILDESITYNGVAGAWDVDYGLNDDADGFTDTAKKSLNKFGEFVDFVYKYNYNLVKTNVTDTSKWDTTMRYIATVTIPSFVGSKEGDIYRYDEYAGSTSATGEAKGAWVRGGNIYSSGSWSRLNIFEDFGIDSSINNIDIALDELKTKFKEGIANYIDVNDIAFHQAIIKFLSGTDNRAKNTYFQIFGKFYEDVSQEDEEANWQATDQGDYKVRLLGDDLDTILATDNNGLQSKAYNLLEPSYDWSTRSQWGDTGLNAFFYMFDQQYEDIIKSQLSSILDYSYVKGTNFNKFFYSIQTEKYPAVAYNHTALIYYETAQIVKDSGALGTEYDNNQIEPIEQSHGSSYEGEKQFMTERKNFLASYAKTALGGVTYATNAGSGQSNIILQARIEFTPYQDFYPCYNYDLNNIKYLITPESDDYRSDHEKYLVKADQDYVVELKESSAATNQGLYQTPLYKKFNITGLVNNCIRGNDTDGAFARTTDFTIDNDNLTKYSDFFGSDYTPFALDEFNQTVFRTLESLTLNNMQTLDTLDLSNLNKLTTVNLSKTTFKRVILPKNVKTLVLPETIETFELYNPIENITFEGLTNLKTVDLSNVGDFDVSSFAADLLNCNNLTSVTFRNLTINVTEEVLNKLLSVQNNITGTINIVDSTGDLAEISFATKENLVSQFGNIDDESNNPKVNYKASTSAFSVNADSEITIFGAGEKGTGLFNLAINSNQVEVVNDAGGTRLHIDYSISSNANTYLTINQYTGALTLLKEGTVTPTVTISIYQIGSSTPTKVTCNVKIQWTAPQVGDFIYCDGTYSSNYNKTKTLAGLIYAVDNTDDTSGTAYIIGKESFSEEGFYLGYSPDGVNGSSTAIYQDLYNIGLVLTNFGVVSSATSASDTDYIAFDGEISTTVPVDSITKSTYKDFTSTGFTGKEDTEKYVSVVESNILNKLYTSYKTQVQNYINYDSINQVYNIKSIDKLQSLCSSLVLNSNLKTDGISSCVLYPYYYAAHLYQPTVANTETLNTQFTQGNWYVPSAKQLARIMYYRGYSATGSGFTTDNHVVSSISTKISSGSTVDTKAIFSKALSVMSSAFPKEWTNIAGVYNTTTTMNTSTNYNSYSYQSMYTDYSGSTSTYQWIPGKVYTNTSSWDINQNQYSYAWRLTKHTGVPFTQFNYSKNG